jgi:hypothetical protein
MFASTRGRRVIAQESKEVVRWLKPYRLFCRSDRCTQQKKIGNRKGISALCHTRRCTTRHYMYPKVFRSSPFPFGNTDRVSGRHTIVVPIGTSQDACVEKQKCASLAQLRIYRSGTRKRAEVLPCGLPD